MNQWRLFGLHGLKEYDISTTFLNETFEPGLSPGKRFGKVLR